jgi:sporulation protein YlmC with PRC-barrel domain
MHIDSLRQRAVIDPDSAARLGTVIDYWVDPELGRVAALAMRPVDVDQSQRLSCARVARVGRHAIMLNRANGSTIPRLESLHEGWLDRRHLKGLVVYTDAGERLGTVNGAHINPLTLEIQSYEIAVPFWRRWFHRGRRVTGESVAWCGRDVLVVRTNEPAKLRPVGRENGDYTSELTEHVASDATSGSRNGSGAVPV